MTGRNATLITRILRGSFRRESEQRGDRIESSLARSEITHVRLRIPGLNGWRTAPCDCCQTVSLLSGSGMAPVSPNGSKQRSTEPPICGRPRNGLTNQSAEQTRGNLLRRRPLRGSALNNTRQNQFHEKGNFNQRVAARRVPDRNH